MVPKHPGNDIVNRIHHPICYMQNKAYFKPPSNILIGYLVGGWPTPSEKIWKSVGMIIPNIWKNVPNHQPVMYNIYTYIYIFHSIPCHIPIVGLNPYSLLFHSQVRTGSGATHCHCFCSRSNSSRCCDWNSSNLVPRVSCCHASVVGKLENDKYMVNIWLIDG
jgi:hypothetical protein